MNRDDKQFISMVLFFQEDKGDPTRYVDWSEERCARLMPAFYKAWQDHVAAEDVLRRVAETYSDELDYPEY